jgi:hypothetical protein
MTMVWSPAGTIAWRVHASRIAVSGIVGRPCQSPLSPAKRSTPRWENRAATSA